jgi:hypothetical protein
MKTGAQAAADENTLAQFVPGRRKIDAFLTAIS